jgi:hypothetical protein
MLRHPRSIKLSFILAFAFATFSTSSIVAQDVPRTDSPNKDVLSIQLTASSETSRKPVAEPTPETVATAKKPAAGSTSDKGDLEADVAAMRAENAAVKEQLRRMEESQRILIEQLNSLRLRLDRDARMNASSGGPSIALPATADRSASTTDTRSNAATDAADTSPAATDSDKVSAKASSAKQVIENRYQDGIIIWKTPDDAQVPFLLKFNIVTQFRYLNTLDSDRSFTDHLGVVREVHARNDVTVNRSMFTLSGYIWDKRLQYQLLTWTAAGAASIIVAGSIGWRFNKHITLTGGYLGIPGSRSLTNTFPYFASTDRTMADNFFRPGFTQGVMASGEITKGLYYNAFLGNSLNTLSITANKIDTNLMGAGSVWWEPLGGYSEPGRSVNMYDDYFAKKKVRIRLGSSFTVSREDRFSNLDTSSPENTAIYNSDGVNAFATGAFAPGVTVENATYKMWATDWGFKYNGLAINGQYYARWLNDFAADGPLPLTSTFDQGYEFSVGYFVVPRKLMVYGRGSAVFGQFKNPNEFGGGVKWHFLPTERLWLNFELVKVLGAPYTGAFSPYTSGMNGWMPMIQSVIAF